MEELALTFLVVSQTPTESSHSFRSPRNLDPARNSNFDPLFSHFLQSVDAKTGLAQGPKTPLYYSAQSSREMSRSSLCIPKTVFVFLSFVDRNVRFHLFFYSLHGGQMQSNIRN